MPQRLRRAWIAAAVLVLLAALWTWAAPLLAERLVVSRPLPRADAILVMAGARAVGERTRVAARLFREGVAPLVVLTDDGLVTGWSPEEQRNPFAVERARKSLVAQGVPGGAIETLGEKVSGTITEARLVRRIASERGWTALLIVTSGHHTRRTLWTFEHEFSAHHMATRLGIEPAPDGPEASRAWWLTREGWHDVGGEYLKALYYRVAY